LVQKNYEQAKSELQTANAEWEEVASQIDELT
jgi:hypothetical protein